MAGSSRRRRALEVDVGVEVHQRLDEDRVRSTFSLGFIDFRTVGPWDLAV